MILYSSYNEYSYYDYLIYCNMNKITPKDFESEECQKWFTEQYNTDIEDYINTLKNCKIKDRYFLLLSQDDNSVMFFSGINDLISKIKFHEGYDIVIYTSNDTKYIGKIYINIHCENKSSHYLMYMFKENITHIPFCSEIFRKNIKDYVDNIKDEHFLL